MLVYLGLKYKENGTNKHVINAICSVLEEFSINIYCVEKDLEEYGLNNFSADDMMELTFKKIDESDIVLVDISEKGIGLGIECGYAFAKDKPIYVIAKQGSDISKTINGIASKILEYNDIKDIGKLFSF